ncbi:MAG: hypothetical protein IJ068_00255 [Bacilli bacterium]|nr:hypothetical protein [Bacilli bacterium]
MSDKQISLFSSSILISDVISYIDNHKEEYEQFLKVEMEKEKNKNTIKKGNSKNEST